MPKGTLQAATPKQQFLDLGIEIERDVHGIEMGVLENGIAYLTQRGLAKISGAARSTIQKLSEEWESAQGSDLIQPSTRIGWLRIRLADDDYRDQKLFIEAGRDGGLRNAYPDVVCMALIEYFAFEAKTTNETSLKNYRLIARHGLRDFIYNSLGYVPGNKWKYFEDRVSILQTRTPDGYFSIFNEISGMVVDLINAGLTVNEKTIPDISVGRFWSEFWSEKGLARELGERLQWPHVYPEYYPQAKSNPQFAWAYPDRALPMFRNWFRNIYLPERFPYYILRKAKILKGGVDEASKIAGLYRSKQIGNSSSELL